MNLANQNAQGTRPKVVGQLSEIIQEFKGNNADEWKDYYDNVHPEAIDEAANRIWDMIQKLKSAINKIDEEMVRRWVEDLIYNKTFTGLKFQEAILKKIALQLETTYKTATPKDESKGIDGYISGKPVSIKPMTYKTKDQLPEVIDVSIIYYKKTKSALVIEYDLKP